MTSGNVHKTKMRGLYKGKYLIAICDRHGDIVDVGLSIPEIAARGHRDALYAAFSKSRIDRNKYKYVLVDCLEEHDDIFAEEDKLFLEFVEQLEQEKHPVIAMAKEYNIPERTLYRRQQMLRRKANATRERIEEAKHGRTL